VPSRLQGSAWLASSSTSGSSSPPLDMPSALASAPLCSEPQSAIPRALLQDMRSDRLAPLERVAAGNELGRLGDPRFRPEAWYLSDEPLLGFVEIPPGLFRMGSHPDQDSMAYADETPSHEINLPAYYMGRYPVTGQQFLAFIEATGHKPENEGSLYGPPNHPVVWLGWLDAMRYCDWLTAQLRAWTGTPEPLGALLRQEGWRVILPSEPEWEKAARGSDGRAFPWGNEAENNCGNFGGTGVMTTSAVGCFPAGASPYGIEDMSGNVWEWTRSVWGNYPYPTNETGCAERESLEVREGIRRVRRGGAFFSSPRSARCAARLGSGPYPHGGGMGCRVVLRPRLPWVEGQP
jgi:formylglycine-generating enzyme required for sulfatase activity